MAEGDKNEAKKTPGPDPIMGDMWFVLGILAVLIAIWIYKGGPQKHITGSFLLPAGSTSTPADTPVSATSTY